MTKKSSLRLYIDRSSRLKQYFLRGHNAWFALAFSLLNFTLIFYKLFLESLDFIPEELKSYAIFAIIFGITYFPLSTILGYLDLKKGTFNAEQKLSREISPIWKELFSRIEKLENNDEEVIHLLKDLENRSKN